MILTRSTLAGLLCLLAACSKSPAPPPQTSEAPAATKGTVEVGAAGKEAVRIEVAEARYGSVATDLEAPGQLTWDEDNTWSMGVVATGKVVTVMAKVGDVVKKGQILARMHTHDVHDTRAFLRQARTELQRSISQLDLAKRNRDRMQRLLELKAISQIQADQAEIEVRNAEAAVKRAQADVDRETQHLTEVLEIPADPEDSSARPHEVGHPDEGELVPIKSSADGVVIERKISVGSVVTTGQDAFVVSDPELLWMIASFPERALPKLRVGQTVAISVQAYPDQTFTGKITRLGEALDRETRTLKVRIEVPAKGRLKPEMYATVRMAGASDRGLIVPAGAIQEIDGRQTVFVESSPGTFDARTVTADVLQGQAMIRSGLREGERVATQGSYFLKGSLVQSREGE